MIDGKIDNRNISEIVKEKEYLLYKIDNYGQKHGWNSSINKMVDELTQEILVLKGIEAEDLEAWETPNEKKETKKPEEEKPTEKELSFLIECILEEAEIFEAYKKDDAYIDINKSLKEELIKWLSRKIIKVDFSDEYKKGLL